MIGNYILQKNEGGKRGKEKIYAIRLRTPSPRIARARMQIGA